MKTLKSNKLLTLALALIVAVSFVATPVAFAGDKPAEKKDKTNQSAADKLKDRPIVGDPNVAPPSNQMVAIDTTPNGKDPNKKKLQQPATAPDATTSATPDSTAEAKAGIVADIRKMAKAKTDEIAAERDDVQGKYNELVKGYNNLLTQLNTANTEKAQLQANYNLLAAALDGADDIKTTLKPKESSTPTVVKK